MNGAGASRVHPHKQVGGISLPGGSVGCAAALMSDFGSEMGVAGRAEVR